MNEIINKEVLEENFHDNTYEIIYSDDIIKIKKEKELKQNKKNKQNKKINKVLNILIIIILIAIVLSVINIAFPEKIEQIKEPIEAYFINYQIEKEAEKGELIPAAELDSENITFENDEENSELLTKTSVVSDNANKSTTFLINDDAIYNFNEDILVNVPEKAYVQSTNENKVLMLNSSKVYNIMLNCKAYEVQENNGKYSLIIYASLSNIDCPEQTSLEGIITTNVENEIITSNRNNITVAEGQTEDINIYFDLTETQFKLIKNEIDNLTFIYRDSYNYREIFATYGGNYVH